MEADLNASSQIVVEYLRHWINADTQALINVLFIRDDDHDQRHKTCLNSAPAREREREREERERDCLND